jgi:tetratricopeptide (TPR) repeat protein
MKNRNRLLLLVGIPLMITGCKKYLDEKPDKKLAVISSLEELQSILDYNTFMNERDIGAGEVSADDYYISDADYTGWYSENEKRMYTWEKDFLFPSSVNDWRSTFRCVYRANTVLDNMGVINSSESPATWKDIKGQALYYRARSFLSAAFIWTTAYDSSTSSSELGLPLRVDSDFNIVSVRSSLKETYDRIVADLKEAIDLLPVTTIHKMRPSKPAAFALLARTYLSMRDYQKAGLYADSSLQLYNTLVDYNNSDLVSAFDFYPFRRFNDEVLTVSGMDIPGILYNYVAKIDSALYKSYSENDMRKVAFFQDNNDGSYGFKGSYDEWATLFTSVATDEVYLIRSECYARAGNISAAMKDLNALLINRWKTGTFTPFTATDQIDALDKILKERRKELLMRGLRWMDIKRLNAEGANISLKRIVNGITYTLPANDLRFALPIPEDVISLSQMQQNPR